MKTPTIVIAVGVIFLFTGSASAQNKVKGGGLLQDSPGDTFLPHKKTNVMGKDYYLVRSSNDQCSVVSGTGDKKPEGMVGNAPYAKKKYAEAAIKNFPECKGGLVEWEHN
jgi:hypothetical protein